MKALTRLQRRFCEEYLLDGNATQAYIRAGYQAKGASAAAAACRLLRNVKVSGAIVRLEDARSERMKMKADEVMRLWAVRARGTLQGIVDVKNGHMTLTDFTKLTPEQMSTIKSVRETRTKDGGSLVVEMHDPHAPSRDIAKHLGMFDRNRDDDGRQPVLIQLNMGAPPED